MPGSFSGGAGPAIALRKNDGGGSLSNCTTCQYDSELEHNNCDLANFEESHGRMRGLLINCAHRPCDRSSECNRNATTGYDGLEGRFLPCFVHFTGG